MTGIIPKSKAKGTDICAMGGFYCIIRSDLGCFMETRDMHSGSDISIYSLHPSCQNGDHYICDWRSIFYIIKGNSYRTVTDLETDSDAVVLSLHPNCRGGDHYFSASDNFYIIFQEKGTYRVTTDLTRDSDAEEHNLPPDCRTGLYFWGNVDCSYLLKPASEWGVECGIALFGNAGVLFADFILQYLNGARWPCVFSVHPDVVNFLPGGLALNRGPAFGIWENIKTITNDGDTLVKWQKKINKKVGYNKEKMTQITHNWKIGGSVTCETGDLAKLIAKVQFTFSAEYGGSNVSTDKESWSEVTEEEEQLSVELKPNQSLYLWQYKLGLGKEPVLFCRDLKISNSPNPPTEVPLAPAQS